MELLFDVLHARSLGEGQRRRILERCSPQIDTAGILHIVVDTSRSQWRNRVQALEQLSEVLGAALRPVRKRVASAPTGSSRRRRIDEKKSRGAVKSMRAPRIESPIELVGDLGGGRGRPAAARRAGQRHRRRHLSVNTRRSYVPEKSGFRKGVFFSFSLAFFEAPLYFKNGNSTP